MHVVKELPAKNAIVFFDCGRASAIRWLEPWNEEIRNSNFMLRIFQILVLQGIRFENPPTPPLAKGERIVYGSF
jgi:hypothetical protein